MLFNSPLYGVFLVSAFVVFWLVRRARRARLLFLVLASYGFYFYGTWDAATEQPVPWGPWGWSALCLGIIFVGSTLDYAIGLLLGKTERPAARRALLLVSVVYYLGVLALFKYFNFAADSLAAAAGALGVPLKPIHLRLVLPFGISFFTFETMSYTIDVYRREFPPCRRYLDYLLFVCFFPHLVAGPIVRPRSMLPQFEREPVFDAALQSRGLWLIACGLTKKIVIGDTLAQNLVNRVFENPERFSPLEVLLAVYGYAFQIYADFSGYTDVALGSALLFGYELPKNFDRPYASADLQDFWRRWHISLSSWLRDYLYVPLGGSRHGAAKTYRNLIITMVLGGLWHGASWNFVIWGALHGVALAVVRYVQRRRKGDAALAGTPWRHTLAVILTFHYVCFCWVFFRAPTFGHAWALLARLPGVLRPSAVTWAAGNVSARVALVLVAAMLAHHVPRRLLDRGREWFVARGALIQGLVLAMVAFALHAAAGAKAEPFVYGQF